MDDLFHTISGELLPSLRLYLLVEDFLFSVHNIP